MSSLQRLFFDSIIYTIFQIEVSIDGWGRGSPEYTSKWIPSIGLIWLGWLLWLSVDRMGICVHIIVTIIIAITSTS